MLERLRLKLEDRGGRPRLAPEVIERLWDQLHDQTAAGLVTIEGGSEAFCEGLDLDAVARHAGDDASTAIGLERFAELLAAIERTPRPVVALVDGPALGGGVGLAAAADLVLASPGASFGLPETLMGMIPAVVFPLVARRIGVPRARLLAMGATTLCAKEALRLGLVDAISPDLEVTLRRYTRRFERMDPRALAEVKTLAADHYAMPAGYQADALVRFSMLLGSDQTCTRLQRFVAGEPPWEEELIS